VAVGEDLVSDVSRSGTVARERSAPVPGGLAAEECFQNASIRLTTAHEKPLWAHQPETAIVVWLQGFCVNGEGGIRTREGV
jgi:hypothetical protein